ncbi:ubiquitin hydrolase [Blumeria hordei DH14]|uniref:Ubiquitin hydrolase n=1 Tax=Blumeria graminis f. sp. hordei (strain DH14) TaxID=546991 RepID=N1JHG7_BLUG1|nr:ubiquitin hydrolase [Blumeria hordei DH14]
MVMDISKNSARAMLHHDDLVTVRPAVNIKSPIGSILRECEQFAKIAGTSLEFGRPDVALQEYLQAYIIATEIIPRHKEYPALQTDRPELYRLYIGLSKKIQSQSMKFMKAKEIIRENNLLHGTQSTKLRQSSEPLSSYLNKSVSQIAHWNFSQESLTDSVSTNSSSCKQPSFIQPKPGSLQGNFVPAFNLNDKLVDRDDLTARFARLRTAELDCPKQDPRIRTQLIPNAPKPITGVPKIITSAKPGGPRDMPSVPRITSRITESLDVAISDLPRAPDAIYSPARGTETAGISNLPSSVRNNSYIGSGQQNAPPISNVIPSPIVDSTRRFPSISHRSSLGGEHNRLPSIPPGSTSVNCEQLVGLLAQGTNSLKILLVDLRSREEFDQGHIMSQFIICVEPITLRCGISGEELADSMVIAPDTEQKMFDKRHEFNLVVVYDQSSTKISDNSKLVDFAMAVYEYGYEKKLQYQPLLLVSGLDGWVDLLGPSSLATSSTGSSIPIPATGKKKARPIARNPIRESPSSFSKKQRKHYSRPLTTEQETVWASTIKEDMNIKQNDQTEVNEGMIYARSTEDFIRRYPELPSIQESMISPLSTSIYHKEIVSVMPKPPTRPAPAIQRQRSSGITEKNVAIATVSSEDSTISDNTRPLGLTGLNNPGVLCYMNTVLQGLSATPWFRELIRNYVYPSEPPIPRKQGESTDPPQLMVRCLSSVFAHLWYGHYDFINPSTFQGYVNAIHNHGPGGFGGTQVQHDCNEFLVMLIDILDDELNPLRNRPGRRPIEEIEGLLEEAPTILDAAAIFWTDWTSNLGSPITLKMKGVSARIVTCDICGKSRPVFDQFQQLLLAIPPDGSCTLNEVLDASYGPKSELIEYQSLQCSLCRKQTPHRGRIYLVYMPDTLIISFMRMNNNLSKIKTRVLVPLSISFENNVLPNQAGSKNQDPRGVGPFTYDVYGLGLHSGSTLASGHYRILARSLDQLAAGKPAGSWHMFNDRNVTPSSISAADPSETSLIFLQRQGKF